MPKTTRRAYLATTAALLTATAGCLTGDSSDGNDTPSGDTDTTPSQRTPTPAPPSGITNIETEEGPTEQTISGWDPDTQTNAGAVQVFTAPDAIEQLDQDAMSTVAYEIIKETIEDTDFQTETLIHVESTAPSLCHSLTASNIGLTDSTITGDVSITEDDSEGTLCGEVIQYPSLFIHVTFEDTPATDVQLTVTNGWENKETLPEPEDDGPSWGTPQTPAATTGTSQSE